MEKRKITKLGQAVPVFKPEGGWQAVELPGAAAAIHQALSDPVRTIILDLLHKGPIRQIDLAKLLTEATGRKFDVTAMRHHLNILEKAGLIAYEEFRGKRTKVKMVYRAADLELRMRRRPKPEITPSAPASMDEWLAGLRREKR